MGRDLPRGVGGGTSAVCDRGILILGGRNCERFRELF